MSGRDSCHGEYHDYRSVGPAHDVGAVALDAGCNSCPNYGTGIGCSVCDSESSLHSFNISEAEDGDVEDGQRGREIDSMLANSVSGLVNARKF